MKTIKSYPVENLPPHKYRAIKLLECGVRLKPKKGQYYLSGARPMAYKAPNDLSDEHILAEVIEVEQKTVYIALNNNNLILE